MTASVVATSRERHSHKAAKQRACEITDFEPEGRFRVRKRRRGRIGTKRSSISDTDYRRDSFRSHLLTAGAHGDADAQHKGMTAQQTTELGTPLVRALALHGVSGRSSRKPLGLNP